VSGKNLYEQFMNKLLVTFYTFGTNILLFERREVVGRGKFEAKNTTFL